MSAIAFVTAFAGKAFRVESHNRLQLGCKRLAVTNVLAYAVVKSLTTLK